jgi:hypothetical protein
MRTHDPMGFARAHREIVTFSYIATDKGFLLLFFKKEALACSRPPLSTNFAIRAIFFEKKNQETSTHLAFTLAIPSLVMVGAGRTFTASFRTPLSRRRTPPAGAAGIPGRSDHPSRTPCC